MRLYEGIFIFPPNVATEERQGQQKTLEDQVKKFEGKVASKNDWGVRPLAYEVKKVREGFFSLWDIELPPAKVDAFRKAVQLNPDVIKFTLVAKELPKESVAKKAPKKSAEKPVPANAKSGG